MNVPSPLFRYSALREDRPRVCGAVNQVQIEQAVLIVIDPAAARTHGLDQVLLLAEGVVMAESDSSRPGDIHKRTGVKGGDTESEAGASGRNSARDWLQQSPPSHQPRRICVNVKGSHTKAGQDLSQRCRLRKRHQEFA